MLRWKTGRICLGLPALVLVATQVAIAEGT